MADGTCTYAGIAGLDLHELARGAAAQYISKLGRVRNVRAVAAVEKKLTARAWLIANDLVCNTQRGQQRARRQRGAGSDPGRVLTSDGLARTLGNELRNDRERLARRAGIIARRAAEVAAATSGRAELLRAWSEVDPLLWLISAQEQQSAARAAWERAAWTPAKPRRERRMPGVLHLRRSAEGVVP